ncbi:MAG: hypothetical protein ABIQ06_03675 [Caldimonas sp.]
MNPRIKQLRDLVVALDLADRNLVKMSPDAYRAAARRAMAMTREEMGLLPIGDFAGPVNALQTFAENIFFGTNGCFADLDGSGRAPVAVPVARALLGRLGSVPTEAVEEISASLFARLRSLAGAR